MAAAAAVALLAVFLAAALSEALLHSWNEVSRVAERADETLTAARSRLFGESYTRAVDDLRRTLPMDESYLVVDGGSGLLGASYWVRYDLAPRRAVFLGWRYELTSASKVRRRLTANLRHVVVAFGNQRPPRLYERYRFLQEIESRARQAPGAPGGPGSGR